MKMLATGLLSACICSTAIAGVWGPTYHSRANCANNESISWDRTQNHYYCTISDHFKNSSVHEVNTGWGYTWRSAAVHWGEAGPGSGWTVMGTHWEIIDRIPRNIQNETVTDCSFYGGWWGLKNNSLIEENQKNITPLNEIEVKKLKNVPKGISVVSAKDSVLPDFMKAEILNKKNMLNSGYKKSDNPYAKNLLSMNQRKPYIIVDNNEPYDTNLKSNLSFIKLAVPLNKISFIDDKNVIGYAAVGGWIKEKNGWSGVSEFFNYDGIGVCNYRRTNYILSNGSIQLIKEDLHYEVNGYPTGISVEGKENSGFVYSVSWVNKEYTFELECANEKYDSSIIQKVIELANRISKSK